MTGQQLKNSILQLAIQGKLVPQDANDEPASELLKRIKAEKERLVKAKAIKKEKPLDEISDDEKPFEIPEGWEWCRLGDVGVYKKGPFGSALTKSIFVPKSEYSVKVYEQKNAIQKDYTLGDYYITKEYFEKMRGFEVFPNDIIISCAGTIGETYVIPEGAPQGIINQALMRVQLIDRSITDFWILFFKYILLKSSTIKGNGSAIKNIPPFDIFKNYVIALPPLSEQHRIVSKLEQLLPLVDEYGKSQEALDKLNAELPDKLRQSILQDAIQGKLGTQDPNDEPASVLLQRIRDEKAKLIKAKAIKKEKPLPPISDDEKPFEIPEGWEWCRLGDLCSFLSRGKSPSYSDAPNQYPVFAQKCNLKDGGISLEQARFLNPNSLAKWTEEYHLITDDVLVNSTGTGTVCRTRLFNESCLGNYPFTVPDSHVSVIRTFDEVNSSFIYYLLNSKIWQDFWNDNLAGSTNQKELYIGIIENTLVPLPPLPEQHRIVQKLNSILPQLKNL